MNLGGLGSTYSGYQGAEQAQADIEKSQAGAQEAAFKLLGAHVLGRALTGAPPQGQGPMPPQPGQPSMSSGPSPGQIPNPMQQASQQAAMAPQPGVSSAPPQPAQGQAGAPPVQGGSGLPEISLQALTQRILQTSPQVRNHPEILLAALERAGPILDRQSKEDLYTLRQEFQKQQLEQRSELVKLREQGLNQRNENITGARMYASDQSLEGRKYTADSLARSKELSNDARRDIAKLSWDTRNEIAQRAEQGKIDRAELSDKAKREIATMNRDAREEIVGVMEAGRDRRADQASGDRRYGVDTRAGTAAAAEEGRNTRATVTEEGKRERSILSAETKQAMQRMSQAARQEIEDARQGGADRRAGLSVETRKEIAGMGIDARKEITGYLETGRNDRAAASQQGQNNRAGARNDLTTRRLDQGDQREARLAAQGQLRADQGYQKLELQKQDLQRKLETGEFQRGSTEQKAALAQQRAIINAQHEYAYKFIQSNSAMSNMSKPNKKAFLDAATQERDASIVALRAAALGKPAAPAATFDNPPPSSAPPVSMLKEGVPQEFKNGQTWTLENGQPKRVK